MRLSEIVNRPLLSEQAKMMHTPSGWIDLGGQPHYVDLKVWENPLRGELGRAINECFAMDGDPNLRGLAHGGKVWVWEAEKATHGGLLEALGLWIKADGEFDYQNPEFGFFMVYGSKWSENNDNPIVVATSSKAGIPVLMHTVAARWRAKMVSGGSWMVDATRN